MCDTPLLYAVVGMVFVVLAATSVMAYLSFKKKKPEPVKTD